MTSLFAKIVCLPMIASCWIEIAKNCRFCNDGGSSGAMAHHIVVISCHHPSSFAAFVSHVERCNVVPMSVDGYYRYFMSVVFGLQKRFVRHRWHVDQEPGLYVNHSRLDTYLVCYYTEWKTSTWNTNGHIMWYPRRQMTIETSKRVRHQNNGLHVCCPCICWST